MTKDAEQKRKRYADDAEYRENKLKSSSAYKKANRAKINAHRRQKYATDSEFRANKLANNAKHQRKRICKAHGISIEEFEAMLARQRGACGICERPFRRTPCAWCAASYAASAMSASAITMTTRPSCARPPTISSAFCSAFQRFTTERRTE